jgi:hypothetical protein
VMGCSVVRVPLPGRAGPSSPPVSSPVLPTRPKRSPRTTNPVVKNPVPNLAPSHPGPRSPASPKVRQISPLPSAPVKPTTAPPPATVNRPTTGNPKPAAKGGKAPRRKRSPKGKHGSGQKPGG